MKPSTFPGELIGKDAEIIASTNQHQVGWKGKIIDETKMMLKIGIKGKVKTLPKKNITFKIEGITLSGKTLIKRSEERLKG